MYWSGIGLTVTELSNLPASGEMTWLALVGVAVFAELGVGLTVTAAIPILPFVGVTVAATVPAVTVLVASKGVAVTVTELNSLPKSGEIVCSSVVGVADLVWDGVGLTVTLERPILPVDGLIVLAVVPAVTVCAASKGVGLTVTDVK